MNARRRGMNTKMRGMIPSVTHGTPMLTTTSAPPQMNSICRTHRRVPLLEIKTFFGRTQAADSWEDTGLFQRNNSNPDGDDFTHRIGIIFRHNEPQRVICCLAVEIWSRK